MTICNALKLKPFKVLSYKQAEIPLSLQKGDAAILVVTGTARYTQKKASYQIEIK